jgi:hypothetical protein
MFLGGDENEFSAYSDFGAFESDGMGQSGAVLGSFGSPPTPCYAETPAANECTGLCNKKGGVNDKCLFSQCVYAGLIPANQCGNAADPSCPSGYSFGGGQCIPAVAATQCPSGYTYSNGQCLPNTVNNPAPCPAGYTLVNNQCVIQAPGGAAPTPPTTTPGSGSTCPTGYSLQGTTCVINPTPTVPGSQGACPTYYVQNSAGTCVLSCPTGYTIDPSGTTCDPPGATSTTTTTTTDLGTEIENFVANYWLYLVIAAVAYLLLFKKR